jgi:hypothetical protein
MVARIGDTNFAMTDTERFSCGLSIRGALSIKSDHLIFLLDDLLQALRRLLSEKFESLEFAFRGRALIQIQVTRTVRIGKITKGI